MKPNIFNNCDEIILFILFVIIFVIGILLTKP